ncbi:TonB-dependent receptor [Fulvivirga imtechensis AK7]|uniref:TonB-dependent receptor n=1 Tax=Fulvivirga imtechensis AK7 TaxID=1237149 RepID=L8JPH6_9BACT|nr:TonB-dependent receptor [Fulvivirga imtechensis]ELR69419.1 TonB-dependent receptor [Fulvivirga imtechensis AK7]
MRFTYIFFIAQLLFANLIFAQDIITIGNRKTGDTHTLKGKVVDVDSRELLVGVNIVVDETKKGVITDINGSFELELDFGRIYSLHISYIGYEKSVVPVLIKGNGSIKVELRSSSLELNEVVVSGEAADVNVKSTDLGRSVLTLETIKELPKIGGETDIFKTITLLPGVSSVGEASSGLNVRGGNFDQNLVLFAEIPLYNPSHMFGFFSGINSDVISDLTIYKGTIPAKFGGRSSAVVKIDQSPGSFTKWRGTATAGIISSKLKVDGPVVPEKLSISVAGRVSYVNWLLNTVKNADFRNSSTSFYDVNAGLTYSPGNSDVIKYAFYRSFDEFNLASDTVNQWINMGQSLSWSHSFSDKLMSEMVVFDSRYNFSINNNTGASKFDLSSEIIDRSVKLNFDYKIEDTNLLNIGAQTTYRSIDPGEIRPVGESNINYKKIMDEQAIEAAVHFSHDIQIGRFLGLTYGVRYNVYKYLGERAVNEYDPLLPRSEESIISNEYFNKGDVIYDYDDFLPRLGLRISFNETTSLKLGYSEMNQFIQVITNTASISPVNIWKLSDGFTGVQEVSQYSVGLFKNLFDNSIETSIEAYYKDIDNVIDYKDGADLLLNDNLETELLIGEGEAYGIEFYLKRNKGKVRGWVSYTYSRSLRKVEGAYEQTRINNGKWFPSNFDKPHDFTAVCNYMPNPFLTLSTIFTYSTGRPVTLPSAKFEYMDQQLAYFDSRNGSRIPDYHRLDLSITFKSRSTKKVFNGEWNFTVYNVYGRQNAYSVFFDDRPGSPPQAYKLSVLNAPFPSLSYTLNFN